MRYCRCLIVGLVILLTCATFPARAQDPTPESLTAAKDLIAVMHLNEQLSTLVPIIVKNLKPAIVQGRAEVGLQYDALAPQLTQAFQSRVAEFTDAMAMIYAKNFTLDDLKALTDFYRTPTGQRLLQKMPALVQESSAMGQKFGRVVGEDVQRQMVEELRKRGVDL